MKYIYQLVVVSIWIAGFVIAKGFWSTLFCIIPFWSWYLVIDYIILHLNF